MKKRYLALAILSAAFLFLSANLASATGYYIHLVNETNMEVSFAIACPTFVSSRVVYEYRVKGWYPVQPKSTREEYIEGRSDIEFFRWIAEAKGAAWYGRDSDMLFEVIPEKFVYETDIIEKENRAESGPKNKQGIKQVPFRTTPIYRGHCTIKVTM